MPILPIAYYSNYYLVAIDFQVLFANLGITYNLPISPAYFLASKFEYKEDNLAAKKTMVQGKPGHAVQDVSTPVYTYTIEAPLIINGFDYRSTSPNFLPYNSLNYFALGMANWQWQQLHGYSANANVVLNDVNVVLKSFEIAVTESGVKQIMVIQSNYLLGPVNPDGLSIIGTLVSTLANTNTYIYNQLTQFVGRTVRNYDIYTQMAIEQIGADSTINANYYLYSAADGVYIDSMTFSITFDIDLKYFINTGNSVVFLIKGYDLSQKFGIVGTESFTFVDNFTPLEFYQTLTKNILQLGGYTLIEYQAPMIVKSRSDILGSDQLVTTTFDFSMFASTYGPGNSPYNTFYLFKSDIA